MAGLSLDQMQQKARAAERAAQEVRDGMVVGLGSGSTASLVVSSLGKRVHEGLHFVGVATSEATARQAAALGIPLRTLDEEPFLDIDIDIDGADEVDPAGDMIKGLGGALLREKMVATSARRLLIVVDESKEVARLGQRTPVPVEVVRFAWRRTAMALRELGAEPVVRGGEDKPFVTDGGGLILDCRFPVPSDLARLAQNIKATLGVIEHGLFLGMRPTVFVGCADGAVRVRSSTVG